MPVVLPVVLLSFLFLLIIRYMISKNVVRLSTWELALAFGAKVLFGCIYGYVFLHYFGGDDTWVLNNAATTEYNRMVHETRLYFEDLSPLLPFERNEGLLGGIKGLFGDWEYFLITRPLALFQVISGGNYYINVTLFSFLSFWGHYWFFTLLVRQFPGRRKVLLLLIFFFPPTLFWLSGIRGDAGLFFFFALLLMNFHSWLELGKKRTFLLAFLGFVGVLTFRHAVGLAILPGLVAWFFAVRNPGRSIRSFVISYAVALVLFFGTTLVSPTRNLPAVVAGKQADYMLLEGNTRFRLDTLRPTVTSFIRVFPQAAANTFVKPTPWEAKGLLQVMASADIVFFWLLVLCIIWKHDTRWRELLRNNVLLALLSMGVALYLFIGYTVPYPGAIVRYKIIPELFLYTFLLMLADLRRIKL